MQRAVAGLLLLVALSGCFREMHLTSTHFVWPGAFAAAVDSGADVRDGLAETEATWEPDGGQLALTAPDLDAAWGNGTYALKEVLWWRELQVDPSQHYDGNNWTVVTVRLAPGGIFVDSGGAHREVVRGPLDGFLANVTLLDDAERAVVVERLVTCAPAMDGMLPRCSPRDVGLSDEDVDVSTGWAMVGGLAGARGRNYEGYEILNNQTRYASARGSWWFDFAYDVAVVESRVFESHWELSALPTGQVFFHWMTEERASEEAAYAKLALAMRRAGMEPPPAGDVHWVHGLSDE